MFAVVAHASPPIMPLTAAGILAEHVGYASGVRSLNDVTHASEHDADAGACLTISTASCSAHVPNAPAQFAAPTLQHQHCHSTDSTVAGVLAQHANHAALQHGHCPAAHLTVPSEISLAGVHSALDMQTCAPSILSQDSNPEGIPVNSRHPAKRPRLC